MRKVSRGFGLQNGQEINVFCESKCTSNWISVSMKLFWDVKMRLFLVSESWHRAGTAYSTWYQWSTSTQLTRRYLVRYWYQVPTVCTGIKNPHYQGTWCLNQSVPSCSSQNLWKIHLSFSSISMDKKNMDKLAVRMKSSPIADDWSTKRAFSDKG